MHCTDMDGMTRRDFLRASGVTGAAALLAGANTVSFTDVAHAAAVNPLPPGAGILVIVTLYGGNDGLNTVVPYLDPIYQARRGELAYAEADLLPLGEDLGLNNGMTGLHEAWTAGRLAIVRGLGYPEMNHSHFTSMDIWQSASPAAPSTSGWIGRWLDAMPRQPLQALNIGNTLPPMLVGRTIAGSTLPVGGLTTPSGNIGQRFRTLSTTPSSFDSLRVEAATAISDLYVNATSTKAALKAALPAPAAPTDNSAFAAQLDTVARLINAGLPTRVYSVSLSGFDTHANEKNAQRALLAQLSSGLTRFMANINATSRANDVTVLAYSEFGRRVPGNLSQGTDHGTSGPAFILGNRIRGGFYGEQPSLADLVSDDLRVTTDFRDVYASLLEGALGTDAGPVLGTWGGRLPLFVPATA